MKSLLILGSVLAASTGLGLTMFPVGDPAATQVERGRYLTAIAGCADCHTPWRLGAQGPEPDPDRHLSGHPEAMTLPPAPALPEGPWVTLASGSMTAWSGPWGVSFTANLTPDRETGLGAWTEEQFVRTIQTGRHLGTGRQVLPPMPIPAYSNMTEADLRAIYAYLQSIPPIRNRVPEPLPPAMHR